MAVALTELQQQYAGTEAGLAPPSSQPNPVRGKSYNFPPKYFRCADESVPWGWRVMQLPGDPESYMSFVEEFGFTPLKDEDGKRLTAEYTKLCTELAAEVNAKREKEKREKNHPTFVLPTPQQPTQQGITLTQEEYETFKAFLAEKAKQATVKIEEPRKLNYSKACEVCGETFDHPFKLANHRKAAHGA